MPELHPYFDPEVMAGSAEASTVEAAWQAEADAQAKADRTEARLDVILAMVECQGQKLDRLASVVGRLIAILGGP